MADQSGDEEEVRRVEDLVSGVAAIDDPVDRFKRAGSLLAVWTDQQKTLSNVRQAVVVELRSQEVSYRKIAKMLGVSPVRVQQIEKGLSVGPNRAKKRAAPPPPPDKESGS